MKTLFLASVLTLLSASVHATDVFFRITSYGQTLIVNTVNWNKTDIGIQIQDQEGHILTTKEYDKNAAGKLKRFNLSNLATGDYTITLSDVQRTYSQSFILGAKAVTIHPEIKTFLKPQISFNASMLKINFLNLGKTATLKILDHRNEPVYQTMIDQPAFNKQYNLSKLAKGDYTVMVSQEDQYYTHAFVLK